MKYDFESVGKRFYVGSSKWDQIISEMGAVGEDVLPVSVADMELRVAPEIVRAIREAAGLEVFGYTNPLPAYYAAVIGWMHRRHNWEIERDWIVLSPGVIPAIYASIRALTVPGDGIVIQPPVYYPFAMSVKATGRTLVENPLIEKDGYYTMDFADLEAKLALPSTKMLILCSPHNPVGRVWTREELTKVGELCLRYDVIPVVDEIHMDLLFTPHRHTAFASINEQFRDHCISLTAPSKTFNLAGLQCSNIIIPNKAWREAVQKAFADVGVRRLTYFAFPACTAAYNEGGGWVDELLELLEENKRIVREYLERELPMLRLTDAEGTYLLWIDCRALALDDASMERLFKEIGRVYFDEGYLFGFGGSGFERINIACPTAMVREVLVRMKRAIDTLAK